MQVCARAAFWSLVESSSASLAPFVEPLCVAVHVTSLGELCAVELRRTSGSTEHFEEFAAFLERSIAL